MTTVRFFGGSLHGKTAEVPGISAHHVTAWGPIDGGWHFIRHDYAYKVIGSRDNWVVAGIHVGGKRWRR